MSSQPIGIFDSGIGGLTVALSVINALPNEQIIYYGDTANLPYGDKTVEEIQGYCEKICDFLLTHNCKVILMACNSASSAAYDHVVNYVKGKCHIINVIDPVVEHINAHYRGNKIGLIGTKQTVSSGVYAHKLGALNAYKEFNAVATPLLVPAIESDINHHELLVQILSTYLSDAALDDIEILILGCTHYPLIKDLINDFYKSRKQNVLLLDGAQSTTNTLIEFLNQEKINSESKKQNNFFFISKETSSFKKTSNILFGDCVNLELYTI